MPNRVLYFGYFVFVILALTSCSQFFHSSSKRPDKARAFSNDSGRCQSSPSYSQAKHEYQTALFQTFLGRKPGPDEFKLVDSICDDNWIRANVVKQIAWSPESFGNRVALKYRIFLHRNPSSSESDSWVNSFEQGTLGETIDEDFLSSDEYFKTRGNSNNHDFVAVLYLDLLNRAAAESEIGPWVGLLTSGTSRSSVARQILDSHERQVDEVQIHFQWILGRSPDPGGLSYGLKELQTIHRLQFQNDLAASDEYVSKAIGSNSLPPDVQPKLYRCMYYTGSFTHLSALDPGLQLRTFPDLVNPTYTDLYFYDAHGFPRIDALGDGQGNYVAPTIFTSGEYRAVVGAFDASTAIQKALQSCGMASYSVDSPFTTLTGIQSQAYMEWTTFGQFYPVFLPACKEGLPDEKVPEFQHWYSIPLGNCVKDTVDTHFFGP